MYYCHDTTDLTKFQTNIALCGVKKILLPKNFPQAVGNIDKCSTSEALDESVPGAWLG